MTPVISCQNKNTNYDNAIGIELRNNFVQKNQYLLGPMQSQCFSTKVISMNLITY